MRDHQRAIDGICKFDPGLKNPFALLLLGQMLKHAQQELGDNYPSFRDSLPCLRHAHNRNQVTTDKDLRLIRFSLINTCWRHHTQIPWLGWSICRQFSCLCPGGDERFLDNLFKTGTIRPSMLREQLDALRSLMRDDPIAPRH